MKIKVNLNGTDKNPWHIYGFKQNPFPQIAKYELMSAMNQLNSLDGDQLKSKEDIAERLKGWSKEFIELCQGQFVHGERISFFVNIPDEYIEGGKAA